MVVTQGVVPVVPVAETRSRRVVVVTQAVARVAAGGLPVEETKPRRVVVVTQAVARVALRLTVAETRPRWVVGQLVMDSKQQPWKREPLPSFGAHPKISLRGVHTVPCALSAPRASIFVNHM